ncbi:hypothetical protein Tco_0798341 [Tanacetum coccineum]
MALSKSLVSKVDDVFLVDGVFDGAFGGDREEDFVMGEDVVVSSSSLDRLTKSCLGGIMESSSTIEWIVSCTENQEKHSENLVIPDGDPINILNHAIMEVLLQPNLLPQESSITS